jgi:hypothetical protein
MDPPRRLSAATPSARSDRTQNNQKNDCADRRFDDHPRKTAPQVQVEARQKPVADQRSNDSDRSVADKSETIAAQDFADQPSGERADKQDNKHALIRKMH